MDQPPAKRSRRKIIVLAILALFLLPVAARAALYAYEGGPRSWRDADWSSTHSLPRAADFGAARILGKFAEGAPWAHLDIAAVSDFSSSKPYADKGASGIPVRTFVALAERLAR